MEDESLEVVKNLVSSLEEVDDVGLFNRVALHLYQKHGDDTKQIGCYHVSELYFGLRQLLEDAIRYRSLVATAKDILGND